MTNTITQRLREILAEMRDCNERWEACNSDDELEAIIEELERSSAEPSCEHEVDVVYSEEKQRKMAWCHKCDASL